MKKLICLILAMVFCMSLACTAYAAESGDGFVSSPGSTEPVECDHSSVKVVGKYDPTCTSEGYTGDKVCEECNIVVAKGTTIAKTAHNYEDGVCTACGADENNPKTGDSSNIALWIGVMAIAVVGLVAVAVVYRKKFAVR